VISAKAKALDTYYAEDPSQRQKLKTQDYENIPTGISLCCDSAFAQKKEFSIFEFPERFSEISCRDLAALASTLPTFTAWLVLF
jgi:hypothetical protein